MISEFFIDTAFAAADGVLTMLPKMEWNVNTSAWAFAKDVLDMICYLLPLGTITSIITLIVSIAFIRIAIAFGKNVYDLLPFT